MNYLPQARGWRLDGGGWVEGWYWATPQYHWIAVWNDQTCFMDTFNVHPDSVSQATGLPDKHGKMIFGGMQLSGGMHGPATVSWNSTHAKWEATTDLTYVLPKDWDNYEIIPRDWEPNQEAEDGKG